MGDKKELDQLKAAAREEEAFATEGGLMDEDLEEVSGGQCLCLCGQDSSCGGGGGGGKEAV